VIQTTTPPIPSTRKLIWIRSPCSLHPPEQIYISSDTFSPKPRAAQEIKRETTRIDRGTANSYGPMSSLLSKALAPLPEKVRTPMSCHTFSHAPPKAFYIQTPYQFPAVGFSRTAVVPHERSRFLLLLNPQ